MARHGTLTGRAAVPEGHASAADVKRGMLAVSDLRRRGWTGSILADHLPAPICAVPNPRGVCGAPMRLYAIEAIEAAEASPTFIAARALVYARSEAAERAVAAKVGQATALAWSIEIELAVQPLEEVLADAMAHYNLMAPEYRDGELWATVHSGHAFLVRIAVNHLRHRAGRCEEKLRELYGRTGRAEATLILRRRVLDVIAMTYPVFGDECAIQVLQLRHCQDPGALQADLAEW